MTQDLRPWPPSAPYPESTEGAAGGGARFPSSAGDRERGKFRPGRVALTTRVAVSNDDGSDINSSASAVAEETNLLLRAVVLGLSIMTDTDLLQEVEAS